MSTKTAPRMVKGTGLIDIVKLVRHVRMPGKYPPLKPEAEALLAARIMPNEWHSHDCFLQLIQFAFRELLGASEQKACDMGAAGGRTQLLGPHKAFMDASDPLSGPWAMRHLWRSNFNFGEMRAERDDQGINYSLSGYRDVPPSHAFMIAGWVRAGLDLAGVGKANVEIREKPWLGDACFSWRISLPSRLVR